MSRLGPFDLLAVFGFDMNLVCLTISRLIAGFRWLVEAEGCRIYNFKLYPALHKLGSRLLIRFLQCIALVFALLRTGAS